MESAHAGNPDVLALAALRRFPDGVLHLHTAAKMTFWPQLVAPSVQLAGVRPWHQTPGFEFTGRPVPPDWVLRQGPVRLSDPEYTAMELAPATEGESIDRILRKRMGTIRGLWAAHAAMAGSNGQQRRARFLLDSRDKAWSAAERLAHRILRAAGITDGMATTRSAGGDGRSTSTSHSWISSW
ncbi:hypothetical protein [Nakamurella lactea]|uniref:hypothetical protein n=1 Tax=Nakamurella lactea TaxID=459515 RepID=UPI00041F212F|nr:hypothetical protein [Nakamurella lactea]